MIDEERIQHLVDSKTVEELKLKKRMFVKELLAQLKSTAPIENESAAIRSILVSVNKKLADNEISSSSSSSSSKETVDVLLSRVLRDLDENNSVLINEGFSAKFGTVVWAKSNPWWPSYVVDPRTISTLSVDVRKRAFSSIKKNTYCVYFYGSGEYGFVSDKQMRDYIDCRSYYELDPPIKYRSQFEMALSLADNEAAIEPALRTIYVNTQIVSILPSSPKEIEEEVGEEGTGGVSAKRPRGRPKKITAATTKVAEESKDGEGESTTVIVKSRSKTTKTQEDTETIKKEPTKATSEIVPTKKKPGRPPKVEKSIPENTISSVHSSSSSSVKRTSSSISQVSADVTEQVDEPRQKITKIEPRDSSSNGDDFVTMIESLSTEAKMDGIKKLISTLERCAKAQGQAPDVRKAVQILQNLSKLSLNIEELKESKAAETISILRKHENPTIATEARNLRHKWIEEHKNKEEKNKVPTEQLQTNMPQPNHPSQPQIQQQEEQSEVDTVVPFAMTAGEPMVMVSQPAVSEEDSNSNATVSGNLCRSRVLRMLTELLVSGHDHENSPLTHETIHRAAVRLEGMAFRVLYVAVPSSTSTTTSSTALAAGAGHSMVDIAMATTMNRYLASISRLAFGLRLSGAVRCRKFLLYATDGAFLTSSALLDLLNAKTADEFTKLISSKF